MIKTLTFTNQNEVKTAGSRKNTGKKIILQRLKVDSMKESEFLSATSNQIRQLHQHFPRQSSVEVKVEEFCSAFTRQ